MNDSRLCVALVSPGAMGSGLGARLVENGVRVFTSLAGRGDASAARAREAGMEPAPDEMLAQADIFLSVVPPGGALSLAERFAPALAGSAKKAVYVDCNAVNPETAKRIADVIAAADADFVDAGIIGMPPKPGTAGPAIYCSGPKTAAVRRLAEYGLRIRELDGPVGAASALKMSYAGITKGLIAIAAAMSLGAVRAGLQHELFSELAESQPELLRQLQRMTPNMFPKAYRWVAEMEEIAGFLDGSAGAAIYEGAADLYRHFADQFPSGPDIAAVKGFFCQTNFPAK